MSVKKPLLLALAIVALSAILLLHQQATALVTLQQSPTATPEPPVMGTPYPTVEIPALSATEEAEVIQIAEADTRVDDMLDGHTYTTTVAVWTTAQGLSLLGGVATFELDTADTFALAWPYVEYDSSGDPIYPVSTDSFTATAVSSFYAFVDLTEDEVVQLYPDPFAGIEQY